MVKQTKKLKETNANIIRVVEPSELGLSESHKPSNRYGVDSANFSNYIRSLIQNWRQGTVASKSRGEIAFSNKKPWKQKGTGRARAGSRRSPLWRKGGVIFGPQSRVRTLKVGRSVKQNVFKSLLWQALESGKIMNLKWSPEGDKPKTGLANKALKEAGLVSKKTLIFVGHDDHIVQNSFSNMPSVDMLLFDQPNAYALAHNDYWVFLDKDVEAFKKMVSTWI